MKALLPALLLCPMMLHAQPTIPDWSALNGGANGEVPAMAIGGNGTVVVAGNFTQAGGVAANHLATWNGNNFQPLGAGINATISSVAVLNGTIYAGGAALSGNYTDVGVWNGTQWVFENAFSGNAPALNVLFAHGGVLYAAGVTMGFAGSMHHVMMRGPGGEWQSIGSTLNGPVRALAWHNGHLVAGGAFTAMQNGGGTNLNHVALFDGSD